jgi:hypothetical protein
MEINNSMIKTKVTGKMTKRSTSRAENAVKTLMEEEISRLAMFNMKSRCNESDIYTDKHSHLLPPTIRRHNETTKKSSYTPKMHSKSPKRSPQSITT